MKKPATLAFLLLVALTPLCAAATDSWRQLGPDEVGWLGQVNTLSFDPHRPSRAFAGLNGGGIARSGDGGLTWRTMSEGLTAPRVSSIVVHPELGRLVYAIADGIIHRSLNDGRTWVRLPLDRAKVIVPDPRAATVVWAGTENGLFRSSDSGDTWERIQANLPERYKVESLAIDTQDPRLLYIGITGVSGAGFWVSENAARSWTRRSRAVPSWLYADLHTARTVFFQRFDTLLRSPDAGRTLQPFFDPPEFPDAEAGLLAPDPQDASTFFLLANNRNGQLPSVFRTTNAGRTWHQFATGLPLPLSPTALAVSSDGHVLLGAQTNQRHFQISRSTTAEPAWEPAAEGLISSSINSVAVGRNGALFISVFSEGVLRSLDGGATWAISFPSGNILGPIAVAPSDPDTLYVGGSFLGGFNPHIVWKTTDGGETWAPLSYLPPLDGQTIALNATDIAVDPEDPETVFLATALSGGGLNAWAGLFRSRDGGQTWQKIGPDGPYLDLEIHPSEPERILALFAYSAVYRSTDRGDAWEKVLDRSSTSTFMNHLEIAPSNPDIAYVTQNDGTLFRSGDGGATFFSLGKRLPRTGIRSIVVDPEEDDTLLFAGIEGVVRLTLGSGRSLLTPAFFTREIGPLLFDPEDPLRLLAGTAGAGLAEYRFGEETAH